VAVVLQGDFARAQAEYLQPNMAQVDGLVQALSSKKIGIVAHFYMDPQVCQHIVANVNTVSAVSGSVMLPVDRVAVQNHPVLSLQASATSLLTLLCWVHQVQGVLMSAAERWPHIHISDSLVMADRAVAMAEAGCKAVCVLGVDFMSENVRAILDEAGHRDVQVSWDSKLEEYLFYTAKQTLCD
jgi:quinolinate synthase